MLQFGASLTDDTNIVIYDRIMFMIQATGLYFIKDLLYFHSGHNRYSIILNKTLTSTYILASVLFQIIDEQILSGIAYT
jgi:hypothetical protein